VPKDRGLWTSETRMVSYPSLEIEVGPGEPTMAGKSLARAFSTVCALVISFGIAGCQTVFPSSKPHTGLGATRSASGDVVVLVRTCNGIAATRFELSSHGAFVWRISTTGDASPVIRHHVGETTSGWTQDLTLGPKYDAQERYSVGVAFSNGSSIPSAIPFDQAEAGSVITDAGRMTEDEFMRSAIWCSSPIMTRSTTSQ